MRCIARRDNRDVTNFVFTWITCTINLNLSIKCFIIFLRECGISFFQLIGCRVRSFRIPVGIQTDARELRYLTDVIFLEEVIVPRR